MKKALKAMLITLITALLVTLCGCAANAPPTSAVCDFTSRMLVNCGGLDIEAKVTSTTEGVTVIHITTPDEISSLEYSWGEAFELSYNGLHCISEKDYISKTCFAQAVYNVLCELRRGGECDSYNDGIATYTGSCPSGSYTARTDSRGNIINISIEEIKLNAEFAHE